MRILDINHQLEGQTPCSPVFRGFEAAIIVAMLSILFAVYLWAPIHDSWWYVTDDYRWPTLLGSDGKMTFIEFLRNCNPSDYPLGSKVNRPTYYFTTSLFMLLFGDDIFLWNIARIVIMASSLGAIGYVLTRTCGWIISISTVAVIASHPLWFEALLRLQSELFSFLGLAFTGLLVFLICEPSFPDRTRCMRISLQTGLVLVAAYAAGSKENITALLLGLSGLSLALSFSTRFTELRRIRWPAILVFSWCLVLSFFIYKGVISDGRDLYGNSISPESLIPLFASAVANNRWGLAVVLLTIAIALGHAIMRREVRLPRGITRILAAQVCAIAYGGFLYYFYRGSIPPGSRYEFPFAFIPLIVVILLAGWLMRTERNGLLRVSAITLASLLTIGYAVVATGGGDLLANRKAAIAYRQATSNFQKRLEVLFQLAVANPQRPIVFRSHGFNDFEPLISVESFLHANEIRNPIYLQIVGYSKETAVNTKELMLYEFTSGFIPGGRFKAYSELPLESNPIIANFSKADLSDGAVGNFWPVW